jgi:cytochrome b561
VLGPNADSFEFGAHEVTSAATPTRYSAVAQTFHWLTVILVGAAYLLGEGGPESRIYSAERATQLNLHEGFGVAVLVVLIARLIWRFFETAPEVPMPTWMRRLSHLVHWILYALLAALPLTAIFGAWLEGHAVMPFGLSDIGPFLTSNPALGHELSAIHETLGSVIIWVAGLHAAAALYHHFFLRDRVLVSMLPLGGART